MQKSVLLDISDLVCGAKTDDYRCSTNMRLFLRDRGCRMSASSNCQKLQAKMVFSQFSRIEND